MWNQRDYGKNKNINCLYFQLTLKSKEKYWQVSRHIIQSRTMERHGRGEMTLGQLHSIVNTAQPLSRRQKNNAHSVSAGALFIGRKWEASWKEIWKARKEKKLGATPQWRRSGESSQQRKIILSQQLWKSDVPIDVQAVRKRLPGTGLHHRTSARKPFMTQEKKKRVGFALQHYTAAQSFWDGGALCDEKASASMSAGTSMLAANTRCENV